MSAASPLFFIKDRWDLRPRLTYMEILDNIYPICITESQLRKNIISELQTNSSLGEVEY